MIRELWTGKLTSHRGRHFTVENARVYSLPDELPPLLVPLPAHFEEATEVLDADDVAEGVVCGPDPERHRAAIQEYVDAGYDRVYVYQIGPDQEGFFDFYEREVLPCFG